MDRQLDNESRRTKSIFERGRNKAITTGVAFAVGAGALAGCGPDASAEGPHTTTPSQTEAPVDIPTTNPSPEETMSSEPTVTSSPVEIEPSTEEVSNFESIPGDSSPEELAAAVSDSWYNFVFTGATEDTIEATNNGWLETNLGFEDYALGVAQDNAQEYADVYLAENWEDNPEMVEYYDHLVQSNTEYIVSAMGRFNRGEPLIEVTESISDVEEIPPLADNQRIIKYHVDGEYLNYDMQFKDGYIQQTFDISDGTARLISNETKLDS